MERKALSYYSNLKYYTMVVNVMEFMIELYRCNDICFNFVEGECSPGDLLDGEPYKIFGTIKDENGREIGDFSLYELYNDCEFYDKCDAMSGDIEVVAATICGKRGNVLKKYIPDATYFDTILILDRITIKEKYRGKGIGSSVVKSLAYMMKYQFGSGKAIFLCASDYESADKYGFDSEEYKEGTNKLVEFYKKFGFKVVKNNVMVYYE